MEEILRKEVIQLAAQTAAQTAVEQYKVETSRLFSIDKAAELLDISRSTIYRKMRAGEIQSVEVWGQTKFSMAAIEACKSKAKHW